MIDGLVVIDKGEGWTSHDVVAKCRGIFGQRRIGHSGTLDPDATGVLLVGLGRVTRLMRFLTDLRKWYVGELVLGTATSTLDASGDITGTWDMADVDLAAVRQVALGFVGEIDQVPPMVSAVKVGGRRLHEIAREGGEVERVARRVTIHSLSVESEVEPGVFRLRVACSSGTYIRSLVADMATVLGGGGHLRSLRRTAIGSFDVAMARSIDGVGPEHVLPPADALRDYEAVTVGEELAGAAAHGKVLARNNLPVTGAGPWRVLDTAGNLLAMYQSHRDDTVKPAVVVAPAGDH